MDEGMEARGDADGVSLPVLSFQANPELILKAAEEYRSTLDGASTAAPNTNFLKGCKWSPDGACLLTASEDCKLRVYDLPEDAPDRASLGSSAERDLLANEGDSLLPALLMPEGETIYDFAWFPAMHASNPVSCVFATTCRAYPVHLWDACTGELRCTYRAYDAVDEVTAATSLAFSSDGSKLYGGFNRAIRVWDTSRPGRDYTELVTYKKGADGLPGIVSCMAFNPDQQGLMAAGSYSGQAGLYDSRTNELLYLLQGQKGGLTQVLFGPDGNFLFTGGRADPEIWCWDVRYQSGVVYKLIRDTSTTNQRIQFDIEPCGRHLATGGQDGQVRVFDLTTGEQASSFCAAEDTVNGFAFHPFLAFAATASGHRRFTDHWISDSEEDEALMSSRKPATSLSGLENVLLVWRFQHEWMVVEEPAQIDGKTEAIADQGETGISEPQEGDEQHLKGQMPSNVIAETHQHDLGAPDSALGDHAISEIDTNRGALATAMRIEETQDARPESVLMEDRKQLPLSSTGTENKASLGGHTHLRSVNSSQGTGFAGLPKLVPFGKELV